MTEEPGVAAAERRGWRHTASRLALDLTPLRRFPAFRRLWFAQGVSFVGTEIAEVALAYQMYQLTGSTLAVGLISLTHLVPLLTLTVIGGAFADAFDRRRVMLVQQFGMAIGSLGLAANAALGQPRVWPLFVFQFVISASFSLGVGAQRSMTPQLVDEAHFMAASALNSVTSQFGAVAGPAFAGLLIKFFDLKWIYLADTLSYAGAIAAVALLPRLVAAEDADRPSWSSIVAGFRYVRRQPVILGFFLVDTNAMIFGMPSALFPAIAAHRFGDPSLVGYLYMAPAAGALLVSLGSGPLRHIRRQGLGVVVTASLWGMAIAAFGFAQRFWLALLLLALAGLGDQMSAILRSVMLYRITPKQVLGRVSGIEFMQVAAAPSIGNLEAGTLATVTSLRFSIVSGGIVCVVGCILLAAAFPALLRYDAQADADA
ncbi:MAG TPA: MFS transporter [Gaiellaceae bacterium]|nr:MFS transporter [Gaiellaceae bacterium]